MASGRPVPEIFGIELTDGDDVGEGELVDSVIVLAEVIGEDGKKRLGMLCSEPMTMWQQYGMLKAAAFGVEVELRDAWEDDDD